MIFESIKQKSRKNYYHNLLITSEKDNKTAWTTIKEIISFKKSTGTLFPKRLVVNELDVFDKKAVAENFNKFFSEIGPKFSFKIPLSLTSFEHFLHGDSP